MEDSEYRHTIGNKEQNGNSNADWHLDSEGGLRIEVREIHIDHDESENRYEDGYYDDFQVDYSDRLLLSIYDFIEAEEYVGQGAGPGAGRGARAVRRGRVVVGYLALKSIIVHSSASIFIVLVVLCMLQKPFQLGFNEKLRQD